MIQPRPRFALWLSCSVVAACAGLAVGWHSGWFETPGPEKETPPNSLPVIASKPTLENSDREYLWQAEHRHLLLGRYGFGPFAQAISRADAKKMALCLAPDFVGQILTKPGVVRLPTKACAEVVREQDSGHPPTVVKGAQWVAQILKYRHYFSRPPKIKFSVKTLHPVARQQRDGPWQGTCLVRIWDEECKQCALSSKPGLSSQPARPPTEVILTLAFRVKQPTRANLGKSGWLHFCSITQTLVARARLPRFFMREVAAERGIKTKRFHDNWLSKEKSVITGGVYLCDFNRDGIMDLLVTDLNCFALYKGLPGGNFEDVTAEMGLPEFPAAKGSLHILAAFVDIDGDGWEDLLLGDRVYRNIRGKKFEDYTFRTNLRLPVDAGGVAIADFDRDGRMDLYVTRPGQGKVGSWMEGRGSGGGNQLWRNLGNWQFEDVTSTSGTSGGKRSVFSAVWLDANNDGWPDLYVINEFGDGVLLVNQQDGTFREHALSKDPCDFGSMGVTCGDIDNDGNIDIYVANMYSKAGTRVFSNLRPDAYSKKIMAKMRRFVTGSQLHRNRGGLSFEPVGEALQVHDVGWAYGAALIDLDNDGWLDLFATCGFMSKSRKEQDG